MIGLFGAFFLFITGMSMGLSTPKRLNEQYDWPDNRVCDDIGIIDDRYENDLEDTLEEFNDATGICPVIRTMYVEDYEDEYSDLESYAYDRYIRDYDDEQHYLIVYAVPEDDVQPFLSGDLEVPDYYWEIMQGDDTDNICTENMDNWLIREVQNGLEDGRDPGEVFNDAFTGFTAKAKGMIAKRFNPRMLGVLVFIGAFFALPIIAMIKNMKKEKEFEYEEVPLTDEDRAVQTRSFGAGMNQYMGGAAGGSAQNVIGSVKIVVFVIMAIFGMVGISVLFNGIKNLIAGERYIGLFMIGFGLIWTLSVGFSCLSVMKGLKKGNPDGAPMTAEYPKAEVPHADYPQADYPEQTDTSSAGSFTSPIWNRTSSYDDDDDDLRRKGFE